MQQGLFVERAQDAWTFSHLTIQEYLAAVHFTSEGDVFRIIQTQGTEDRWREIFRLAAGLIRADDLLERWMLEAEGRVSGKEKVLLLLTWTDHWCGLTSPPEKAAARRIILVYLDRCHNFKHYHSRDFVKFDNNPELVLSRHLDLDLDLSRQFDLELDRGHKWLVSQQVVLPGFSWEEAIKTLPKDYSSDDAQVIHDYLTLLTRMHECKQAALRVTGEKWEALCERIARPPRE